MPLTLMQLKGKLTTSIGPRSLGENSDQMTGFAGGNRIYLRGPKYPNVLNRINVSKNFDFLN